MKNKNLIFLLIGVLTLSLVLVACSSKEEGVEELSFEDEEFRSQLLGWLDLRFPDSHEGVITEERLRQHDLTVLPIMDYRNIESIEDIKILPYLEEVKIIGSEKLKDYSPLHNLKMLRDLKIVNFSNEGFKDLEAVPSLLNLDLSNNPGINLDFLPKFPSLNYLNVNSCKLGDFNHIKSLNTIERLDFSYNNLVTGTDLITMKNLKIVDLRHNPINNFRWLSKLENEKLTIIISPDVYKEHFTEKLMTELEEKENPKIKVLDPNSVSIENVLTTNKLIEEKGIKIYVN